MKNQSKIEVKMRRPLNIDFSLFFEDPPGPKTLQDRTRIRPGPLKTPQDAPKNAQNRLEIGPRDSTEPSRRHLGSVHEAFCRPEAPKNCPERFRTSILKDSGTFLVDFGLLFYVVLGRF